MAGFVVSRESLSDDVSSLTSSYDDGPAEGGGCDGVGADSRLYIFNRAGTGEVHYLPLVPDKSDILSYRPHLDIWKPLIDVMNFGVVEVDNFLYIIGGFNKSQAKHLKRVLRYDPSENLMAECSPMLVARSKFGICARGGMIYVSGGERSDGRVTGSCEMYDIQTDNWTKAGMMVAARANHTCAVYGDEMFCAGGYHGNTNHNNIWVYEDHRWKELDEHYPHLLPCPLDRFTITTLHNTLYFIGGVSSRWSRQTPDKGEFTTQRRVFSFTTGISAVRESAARDDLITPWGFKLPPMNHARHSHGAVVLGRKLYVVGGSNLETGQSVNISEFYDTETGMWEEDFRFRKGDMSSVCCVILDVPRIPVTERKMTSRLKWVLW